MERKTRFRAGILVVVSIVAAAAVYVLAAANLESDMAWTIVTAVILAGLAVVAIAIALNQRRDLEKGYPKEDERSRAIRFHAGYLAFLISLYLLFGMSMFQVVLEDHPVVSLPLAEWGMIYVAVMGLIFLVVRAYLNRKGAPA